MEHLVMQTRLQLYLVLPVEPQRFPLRLQLRRSGGCRIHLLCPRTQREQPRTVCLECPCSELTSRFNYRWRFRRVVPRVQTLRKLLGMRVVFHQHVQEPLLVPVVELVRVEMVYFREHH